MRFALTSSAVLALVASVAAQEPNFNFVTKPASNEKIAAGKTYRVEWTLPAVALPEYKGPIEIVLVGGAEQLKQFPIATLAQHYDNSKNFYDWAVDSTLGSAAIYGLQFYLESNRTVLQYSNPFTITPTSGGAASSGAGSSSSVSPPKTTSTSTKTSVTVTTSGTTISTIITTTGPAPTGGNSPTDASSTRPAPTGGNSTQPATPSTSIVRPNGAVGVAVSGSLALFGGVAALMLAL